MMENTQQLVEGSLGLQTDRITFHDRIEEHKELTNTKNRDEGNMAHGMSDGHLKPTFSDAPSDKAFFETPDSDIEAKDTAFDLDRPAEVYQQSNL